MVVWASGTGAYGGVAFNGTVIKQDKDMNADPTTGPEAKALRRNLALASGWNACEYGVRLGRMGIPVRPNSLAQEETPMKKLFLLAGAAALFATPALPTWPGELSIAQTHAGMAATQADIAMAHMHLQHAVNCLVGPGGTGFDAAAGNPSQVPARAPSTTPPMRPRRPS